MPTKPKYVYNTQFDRSRHVFYSDYFSEIIKDAIRFFNGTPVLPVPPPEKFYGAGVYALYYIGSNSLYKRLYELNRTSFAYPIYVGKAVPAGWRQARAKKLSNELFARLNDHYRSITAAYGLEPKDFRCRFIIMEGDATDMIGMVEAALIRLYKPVWNSVVDGFGNHDPGEGRYGQAKSDWDIIHPGREWAEKCTGKHSTKQEIINNIRNYFETYEMH